MTFNPCLPRLSSKAGLSQGGSKALLPVKSSPQAIIMSVGDAVGAPAKEAEEAAYARRTSRASPGGRTRGTPRRCSRPHPAWLQGSTAATAAVNQLTPASTAVKQLTPSSTAVTWLQLSQKLGGWKPHMISRHAHPGRRGYWLLW